MTAEVTLHRWRSEAIRLSEALDWLRSGTELEDATALLSSPTHFMVGRSDAEGRITGSDGDDLDLQQVFEARVFTPMADLRWLRDGDGGTAVIASEEELRFDGDGSSARVPVSVERLERNYLVWGAGTRGTPADGWSRLASGRIGTLDVPLADVAPEQRVQLRAVEYLAEVDRCGNAAVIEERLVELATHQGRGE